VLSLLACIRRISALLGGVGVLGLCTGASAAAANVGIERVWSFNGGAVDVIGQANGTLIGIVSAPTKFAKCIHPKQEQMWIEMRRQADGSYWGLHRWYFEPTCTPNPLDGPTAWRVLEAGGKAFLRVCFSAPGSDAQPTIAADGSYGHATYGCVDSRAIAPLPPVPPNQGAGAPFKKAVVLPAPPAVCRGRGSLKILLRDPKFDPLKRVIVWVNGEKAADLRSVKGPRYSVVLRHLPSGAYKVKVLAITILSHRLAGSRLYGKCSSTPKRIRLHNGRRRPGAHGRGGRDGAKAR
jgi:hypothetical protein